MWNLPVKSAHAAFPEDGINALKGGIDFYQKMNHI